MRQEYGNKWIEIDTGAVKHNLQVIKDMLGYKARFIAVLKNNAYGHGAREIARILMQNGVDYFAVSFWEEALELRKAGILCPVLVFSPLIDENHIAQAISNDIILTVASQYDGELIDRVSRQLGKAVTVHIKIETGLGRLGLNGEEAVAVCRYLQCNPYVDMNGIYTHMAEAGDANQRYTEQQFSRFKEVIKDLSAAGFYFNVKHCANSAVFLKYPHMWLDAVRIGTLLSGQHPVGKFAAKLNLLDPYIYKTRLISLRVMEKGSYLGYARTYRLRRKTQIGVIPVGYADGLAVQVINKPSGFIDLLKVLAKIILSYLNISRFNPTVIIKDKTYPLRGKIFMQMALIEIPLHEQVRIGEEVEVPVKKTLTERDTVRIYAKDGEAGKMANQQATHYLIEDCNQNNSTLHMHGDI